MTDTATLLAEFVDALTAGGAPEASDFIARAESEADRKELAGLITDVLDLLPDTARHPRDQTGALVLGLSRERIAEAVVLTWPEAMPIWRSAKQLTVEQLATRTLEAAELETTPANVTVAGRWIAAMEAGSESIKSISAAALAAIASALGIDREELRSTGDFEPHAALAFRADGAELDGFKAHSLVRVVDQLDAAMPPAAVNEVDAWFSADAD